MRRAENAAVRLAVSVVLLAMPVVQALAQGFEGAEFQSRREAWYEEQRTFPSGQSVEANVIRARLAMQQRPGFASSLASALSGNWTQFGPFGFTEGSGYYTSAPQTDNGRVDYIDLHPTASNTMLIGAPYGGVWLTTTGGDSWTPLFDGQCSLRVGAVRYDPVNPRIVYAATYRAAGVTQCGLFKSTDGGATWTGIGGNVATQALYPYDLYVDPQTAGGTGAATLLVATATGLLRSADGGSTWQWAIAPGMVHSLVALPGNPNVLFAGVSDNATSGARTGLWRSADKGATWTQLSSGAVDLTTAGRLQLAVSPKDPTKVWLLAGSKTSRFLALARWDDTKQALTGLTAAGVNTGVRGSFGAQATYDLVLKVDPEDPTIIYAGGVRLYRSIDGGVTFKQIADNIHCDWHFLVIDPRDPRRLFGASDGGVFYSPDRGDRWVSRNQGLAIAMVYPGISQHPTDRQIITAGLQDNGSLLSNATTVWSGLSGGDGGFTAIHPTNPSIIYTEAQWGPAIYRRDASGSSLHIGGISLTDRASFIPPLVMDPVTPTTLYFGSHRLYRTIDEARTWTPISGDLTKGTGGIMAIAIAPSDPRTIYVGTGDGNVQVSRDAGATFTLSTGLPLRTVTDFAVDRTDPTRALVTFSGSGSGHVYLTTDAGATWTNITNNLTDTPVNAVVMIPDGPNHFFVGGDVGVFESTDAGATWTRTPGGLPNVVVHDIHFNVGTQQLMAATYGRGLFYYSLAVPGAVLRGDVNRDGRVDAADAAIIQLALNGNAVAGGEGVLPYADANCNGVLDLADLLIVLRAAVSLTTAGACVNTIK